MIMDHILPIVMGIINYKGRKIFRVNSFIGNNYGFTDSPEINKYKKIRKESELFRNTEELMKKKKEIYKRKIKRESSKIRKELLKKEKDRDIKEEKLNLDISSAFSTINKEKSNSKNKIVVNRKKINIDKIKKKINILYNKKDEEIKNKSILPSYSKILNSNNNHINNTIQPNKFRKKKYKYKINRNNINLNDENTPTEKRLNTISNINDSNLYNSMRFKTSIYISNHNKFYSSKNFEKINMNKESILNNTKVGVISRYFNKNIFNSSNKNFIEDNLLEPPIIYSDDKKMSIKIHSLQNINETFFGKRMTRDKLKMQRAIIMTIDDKVNKFKYKKMKYDSNKKPLYSIKEEEKSKMYKFHSKYEIKGNIGIKNKIRMKYLNHLGNKK